MESLSFSGHFCFWRIWLNGFELFVCWIFRFFFTGHHASPYHHMRPHRIFSRHSTSHSAHPFHRAFPRTHWEVTYQNNEQLNLHKISFLLLHLEGWHGTKDSLISGTKESLGQVTSGISIKKNWHRNQGPIANTGPMRADPLDVNRI